MMNEILYQGHGSLRLKLNTEEVIYIDPFMGNGYEEPADLILVTHQHPDHNQIDLPVKKEDIQIWQNFDFHPNGSYEKRKFNNITIEAVEAYNHMHKKDECVGYLLEIDGKKIYIAGDTGVTTQMEELGDKGIDIAFIPIDGIFTMDLDEAKKAASLINAKTTIPYHIAPGKPFDEKRAMELDIPNKKILKNGEKLYF